jgi:hypothetical protein
MPINALTAGVAALAINSTAFTIEIFRGGFAAVPVAQHDAARALGLRPALIMALVVVPQVFRIVLPPLGNQIVSVRSLSIPEKAPARLPINAPATMPPATAPARSFQSATPLCRKLSSPRASKPPAAAASGPKNTRNIR